MRKYNNKITVINGIRFDSKREAERYTDLYLLQKAGEISNLQMQVPFLLIPSQKKDDGKTERKCEYIADFVYTDRNGKKVVEDTKGFRTKDYIIKRKLMLEKYNITIKEI